MTSNDNTVPQEFHTITPFLIVNGASKLIDFLKYVFEAKEINRYNQEEAGLIMHAEVKIGDSMIMLSDSTTELNPITCMLYVYVKDADAVYKKALQSGATSIKEPRDEDYGDRCARVVDPFGNQWWIATHKGKKVIEEQRNKESENMMDESQTFSI